MSAVEKVLNQFLLAKLHKGVSLSLCSSLEVFDPRSSCSVVAADLACSVRVTVGITVVCRIRAVVVEQLNLWGRPAMGMWM